MNKNKYTKYWIALSRLLEGKYFLTVYNNFENGEVAWLANKQQLLVGGLSEKTINRILEQRKLIDLDKSEAEVLDNKINVVTIADDNYPTLLKNTADPPGILFYKGNLPSAERTFGVVGSRKLTAYNKTVGLTLTRDLAKNKVVLISGLARGIDGLAHQASVEQGMPTFAVVGTGLLPSDIYPSEHKKLAEQIIQTGGGLISEYPPGAEPLQHHFPMRNRIIAGLSKGVVVISAAQKSGALITAYTALDENREVFAVPGQITDPMCAGSNALLKRGAHVVTSAEDILAVMNWEIDKSEQSTEFLNLSPEEKLVYATIGKTPIQIDEIVANASLDKTELMTQVTVLELKGAIKDIGGKRYIRL